MNNDDIKRALDLAASREKQLKRQNEYIKANYDRVSVTLPKGTKEKIKSFGFSVNEYINLLVKNDLENR